MPEGTDDIIGDPLNGLDLEDVPRRRKPGRPRKGWTGFDAKAKAAKDGTLFTNATPAWSGARPGEHPMLPSKPPGAKR